MRGVSWRSAGDARRYDKDAGSLGRVELGGRPFVCEIAVRFTNADLTDASVDGGVLDRASVAATFYAQHDLKLMVDYGVMTLSKRGIGHASSVTSRFQWELR
jgi:phosphate-selective porin